MNEKDENFIKSLMPIPDPVSLELSDSALDGLIHYILASSIPEIDSYKMTEIRKDIIKTLVRSANLSVPEPE